jgi:hypothetical protein
MTWAQYWALQWKDTEVSMAILAVLVVLGIVGFIGYMVWDKIQDWRGQ